MCTAINKKSISYDSYDKMAKYYYEVVDKKPFNALYERPALLSLLPDVKGKVVLDAGCAAGWYTKWLLDNGAKTIAIDFNKKMVDFTNRRVESQCLVQQADLNNPLDFLADESIDIIISSLTLHYIENWDFVFNQFYRKLKKNGIVVFSTHHPFMDFHMFNIENYFNTTLIHDEWETNNGKVKVDFFRRPLQDIINPVLNNNFEIIKLLEPFPTKEFEKIQPKTYKRLCNNPHFLFIKAVKK